MKGCVMERRPMRSASVEIGLAFDQQLDAVRVARPRGQMERCGLGGIGGINVSTLIEY